MRLPNATALRVAAAMFVALAIGSTSSVPAGAWQPPQSKLDAQLRARSSLQGRSRVIVRTGTPLGRASLLAAVPQLGGSLLRQLPLIDSAAIDLPNGALIALAADPRVEHLSLDRPVAGANERTGATVGSTAVRSRLGLDGSGIGVAIVDSGVMPAHDDLAARVERFVDFTSSHNHAYDDFGHGTHVAGIVAGSGADSGGARAGIAPGAQLTVLKALDGHGIGHVSDVVEAIGYAVAHKDELNIRVINLSIAAGVYESYLTDPLTVAAREAVDAGIVVVAAAGNNGRGPEGQTQYGGITAPGNAPWVLTVGASSHMGTIARGDDTMAAFSSRGPGAIDYAAKPDLVAPGVGIESLSDPQGALYQTNASALLAGTVHTSYLPYMSLSGTSMSAPVVTGTVALMLQANPALTPNAVKAILQYTAQVYAGYDPLTQGAGFLNADGAVSLAAWFASPAVSPYPDASSWSRHIIWGNRMLDASDVTADSVPWSAGIVWGDPSLPGLAALPNVVWGALCGGADCGVAWDNHLVATTTEGDGETVVWGTVEGDGETVVWGTSCTDPSCRTVVWGGQ